MGTKYAPRATDERKRFRDVRPGEFIVASESITDDGTARVVAVGPASKVFPASCCASGHAAHEAEDSDGRWWHVALASEVYPDTFPIVKDVHPDAWAYVRA